MNIAPWVFTKLDEIYRDAITFDRSFDHTQNWAELSKGKKKQNYNSRSPRSTKFYA